MTNNTLKTFVLTYALYHYKANLSLETIVNDINANQYFGDDTAAVAAMMPEVYEELEEHWLMLK